MKKKHVVLIVVAILAVAGGAFAYSKCGPKPTEVEVAAVGREDIQANVTANGKVQAKKKVDISATIPGQITLLAVKEGDRVSKGQLLLQIDAVNPRATARSNEFSMEVLLQDQQSANANLGQARTDLRRAEENFAARIIPEAEVQRARTAVTTGEAAAQAAASRTARAPSSSRSPTCPSSRPSWRWTRPPSRR